jgi:D-tyrosyl-tRNA(Tyr) deacylase
LRAVVTRVSGARVIADGVPAGQIGRGFLVLLGVGKEDRPSDARKLAKKICGLRVFEDGAGKMNVSLADAGGELLVVSNFTLYASCARGRRPDFFPAAAAPVALELYELFLDSCRDEGFDPQTGVFGAEMAVESVNDGPVTLIIDSAEL